MTRIRLKIASIIGFVVIIILSASLLLDPFYFNDFTKGALFGLSVSAMFLFVLVAWKQVEIIDSKEEG